MKTTEYLYGCTASEFKDLPYEEALSYKIAQAQKLVGKLLEVDFMARNDYQLSAVQQAIKHNENLIKEIKSTI